MSFKVKAGCSGEKVKSLHLTKLVESCTGGYQKGKMLNSPPKPKILKYQKGKKKNVN